jgi:hypothetical protein
MKLLFLKKIVFFLYTKSITWKHEIGLYLKKVIELNK